MTTYLSTAFFQQCFAMHRHDLVVKRVAPTGVVVSCRQCCLRHSARLGPWEGDPAPTDEASPVVGDGLLACATNHLDAVVVQHADVQQGRVDIACKTCRSTGPFRLVECVTRELGGRGAP